MSQLSQIAVVYLTNRQNWWVLGWLALMALPAIAMTLALDDDGQYQRVAMQLIGLPVGAVVFVLAAQSKWQFCNPRARVTPHYAAPHLTMLAAASLLSLVGLPLVYGACGFNMVGCAAAAVALAAPFVWASHATSKLGTFIAVAQFFSLYSQRVSAFWMSPHEAAANLPVHVAVLIAGWATIAAWLWRLSQLREDMDDYFLPLQAQVGSATRMERAMASRTIVRQMLASPPTRWVCDWWHDKLARLHATSPRARQWLLRYGFTPTPMLLMALWMSVLFFALLWYMSRTYVGSGMAGRGILPSMSMFILMPAIFPSGMLAMRRGRMPQELMWPLDRRQYVSGLFKAVAMNAAAVGAITLIAMIALLTIVAPAVANASTVAAIVALAIGTQCYAYGAMTNTSRIQSAGKRNVMMMVALIPALVAMSFGLEALRPATPWAQEEEWVAQQVEKYLQQPGIDEGQAAAYETTLRDGRREHWLSEQPQPLHAWFAAAGCAIGGAALIVDSRRRWLRLELA